MRAVKAKNTSPEILVRRLLRAAGFTGYRLHRTDLPGTPDIAFIQKKRVIFVQGCFWHGHDCREGSRRPRSRQDYWLPKIAGNQLRDERHRSALNALGWDVLTIWDCETSDDSLMERLVAFVMPPP